jgi:hypothetical protein
MRNWLLVGLVVASAVTAGCAASNRVTATRTVTVAVTPHVSTSAAQPPGTSRLSVGAWSDLARTSARFVTHLGTNGDSLTSCLSQPGGPEIGCIGQATAGWVMLNALFEAQVRTDLPTVTGPCHQTLEEMAIPVKKIGSAVVAMIKGVYGEVVAAQSQSASGITKSGNGYLAAQQLLSNEIDPLTRAESTLLSNCRPG